MPGKVISFITKPRNLRLIILTLILLTVGLLIISYFATYLNDPAGSQSSSGSRIGVGPPTPISQLPSEDDKEQIIFDSGQSRDSLYANVGRRPPYQQNRDYNARKNQSCDKILTHREFKPDIDAVVLYPTLQFEARWIDTREFWNNFFEERYRNLQKLIHSPHPPMSGPEGQGQQPPASKYTLPPNHLKVFVIPHSHTDPGWLYTFEDYFYRSTQHIIDNAVDKLIEFPQMRFQLSEISFLAKWWDYAHPRRREGMKKLVESGRLEIVTGGWVMTDEATVHLYSMIDQLIEGHEWVRAHLGVEPKSSWSVDPFGHGSTFPYLLKESGIGGMVIQRIHYAWKKWFAEKQSGDFQWVQRWDQSNENSILCHNAPFDIYSIKHSCGPNPMLCLNFDFRNLSGEYAENFGIMSPITRENIKSKAELLLEQYGKTGSLFPHNVAMISLGDDFRYAQPIEWNQQYYNYMAMFNYINTHKDVYKAEIKFGTISEYFKEVQERFLASGKEFPTFSGDFFVYSDIFSEGRPAYWSGYYSTRPYWKKFYRETEHQLRSAEILFTFSHAQALRETNSSSRAHKLAILNHEYSNLIIGRRWLALFAHHDATTGTSKVKTMMDYGQKLLDAKQFATKVQLVSIQSILFPNSPQTQIPTLSTDFEQSSFNELPKKLPILPDPITKERKIILFNSLGWKRTQLIKIVVESPTVKVIGPNGQGILSQLNPVMDLTGPLPKISNSVYELLFLASMDGLTLNTYRIVETQSLDDDNGAVLASIYCRNCIRDDKQLFGISQFEVGNIQLSNNHHQLLFDRNTGFLLGIKLFAENLFLKTRLSFGSYGSVDFKSGAYLLKLDDADSSPIPFPNDDPKIFIISGPVSSELSVAQKPLVLSTRILHSEDSSGTGSHSDNEIEHGIYLENSVNLGQHKGEVFMRFDTELNSSNGNSSKPTFYTDQNGFTMEKRVKFPKIKLEGNYYPITTQGFLQDETRGLRLSLLVDRAHGISSWESGRLETLIDRRIVYDDGRGMSEGVMDTMETGSNYMILLEKLPLKTRSHDNQQQLQSPTILSQHLSQSLNYPVSLYVVNGEPGASTTGSVQSISNFPLLTHSLPCDSHFLTLRTINERKEFDVDTNLPSFKALMIVQKLANEFCNSGCHHSNNNNNNNKSFLLFSPNTKFNGKIQIRSITQSSLTGSRKKGKNEQILKYLHDIRAENPYEIKTVVLEF